MHAAVNGSIDVVGATVWTAKRARPFSTTQTFFAQERFNRARSRRKSRNRGKAKRQKGGAEGMGGGMCGRVGALIAHGARNRDTRTT